MQIGDFIQHKGRVGIFYALNDGMATVYFVNELGENIEKSEVKYTSISPAAEDDIPESRRKRD